MLTQAQVKAREGKAGGKAGRKPKKNKKNIRELDKVDVGRIKVPDHRYP